MEICVMYVYMHLFPCLNLHTSATLKIQRDLVPLGSLVNLSHGFILYLCWGGVGLKALSLVKHTLSQLDSWP